MSKQDRAPKKKRSSRLTAKFHEFITLHSPVQVSRHLRCIVLDYISYQVNTGLPPDFNVYAWELYDLFDLLDCAADEEEKNIKK
jgi:hypothetical protein